jgi:hypothetical protein
MIDLTINKTGLEHNIRRPRKTTSSSPPSPRCSTPRPDPRKDQAKLSHTWICGT